MSGRAPEARQTGQRRLLALVAAFTVWFIVLCGIYAAHAWGCQAGWSSTRLRLVLGLTVLVSVAGLVLWIRRRADGLQDQGDFLPRAIRWATWAGIAASGATLLPPLLLTPCG